jgi:Periplasmic binding protein
VRAIATAKALNWKPNTIVINSVAAVDSVMRAAAASAGADFVAGAVSTAYLKNPTNPGYATNANVKTYRSIMERFSQGDPNNTFHYYGVAKAYDVVRLLYLAGRNPTRESLMAATRKMNWTNPFAIKGVKVTATARDRFPLSQIRLVRYTNGSWTEFGPLIDGRAPATNR